mmetsp:Transcript_3829/g.9926  ORF Transcript_3829/g.9926 Transcript_3829/m.9926 type:complete len:180 (+) Transcript_3829:452-991(+)
MLADEGRARAYDTAIGLAYADALADAQKQAGMEASPIVRALDIGTGSGLLSLMLTRAHQQGLEASLTPSLQVHACEMLPPVATAARAVLASAGLETTVCIVTALSSKLTVCDEHAPPARPRDADFDSDSDAADVDEEKPPSHAEPATKPATKPATQLAATCAAAASPAAQPTAAKHRVL